MGGAAMMRISVTTDASEARKLLVRVEGTLARPRALNDALGRRLARELQGHFRERNRTPNRLGGARTNFWNTVAGATALTEVTDAGAVVSIAERRFRIHLFGGTVRPTGGRKWLTIPLVAEAHGRRVSQYEADTGRKLFIPKGGRVLMEKTDERTVRAVYALRRQATVPKDERALPPMRDLARALTETGEGWISREMQGGGGAA
jgi:hypothetical protein